jgi:predicted RNA-binding Zn ribbon-like protein
LAHLFTPVAPGLDVLGASSSMAAAIPHTVSEHLCIDFVNSLFTDHTGGGTVYDRLASDEWQRWFSERCGVTPERPPGAVTYGRLVQLRGLLRRLLESRQPPRRAELAALNVFLSPPQSWQLAKTGTTVECRLMWRKEDWLAVMAATVVSYANLLVGGGLDRIRTCSNPNCTFVFSDDSRNQTRRWCDAKSCGNLVKVRRHRALHPGGTRASG